MRYIDSLSFLWELTSSSDPKHCLSVTVCIYPQHDMCQSYNNISQGYAYFGGLISGLTYTANITTTELGGATSDFEIETTCKSSNQ